MKLKLAVILASVALFFVPSTASAEKSEKGCKSEKSGNCNRNGRDCRGSEDCSSLSPSFEDSPIVVCIQPGSCQFDGEPSD